MEIKNLDELQKLDVKENDKEDIELCRITCLVTCEITGISPNAD